MTSGDLFSSITGQHGQLSHLDTEALRSSIRLYVSELLLNDFTRLVQLLYRVDVDENKLKKLLKEHPDKDAAELITNLILERLKEKDESRTSSPSDQLSDEERW